MNQQEGINRQRAGRLLDRRTQRALQPHSVGRCHPDEVDEHAVLPIGFAVLGVLAV